jgi:hypothetical protein
MKLVHPQLFKKRRIINQNKSSIIKDKLFATSLQFFLKPVKSKRLLLKIFWATFLISSIFGNFYYVFLNIIDFLDYSTTTSIYQINENESEFPAISFCCNKERDFDFKIFQFWFNSKDLTKEWKDHFEVYQDILYGRCYRLNTGRTISNKTIPIKKIKKSGLNDGLRLEFYVNTSYDYGSLKIFFHNYTQIPPTIYNKGSYISTGYYNTFILKRIYDQKLEQPYNNCYKNVSDQSEYNKTIINYLSKANRDYSQKDCIHLCKNLKYNELNNCSCYLDLLDEEVIKKPCYNSVKNCVDSFLADFDVEHCYAFYCPLECNSITYEITHNIQPLLAQGKIIKGNYPGFQTWENMTKTYYQINVFYENLQYTLISQQPKIELFGLISNIGGTFSLFLDLSFFSFWEFFDFLIELIYLIFMYE